MLSFLAAGFSLAKAQQEPQGLTEDQDQASSTPSEVPILPIDEIEPNEIEPQAIRTNANVRGQLSSALDQDLYRVSLPSSTSCSQSR